MKDVVEFGSNYNPFLFPQTVIQPAGGMYALVRIRLILQQANNLLFELITLSEIGSLSTQYYSKSGRGMYAKSGKMVWEYAF